VNVAKKGKNYTEKKRVSKKCKREFRNSRYTKRIKSEMSD
jgi:hypothetical protein